MLLERWLAITKATNSDRPSFDFLMVVWRGLCDRSLLEYVDQMHHRNVAVDVRDVFAFRSPLRCR